MLSTRLFSHENNVVTALFNHQYRYNLLTRLSDNDNNNEQACPINIVFSCSNNREQSLLLNEQDCCITNKTVLSILDWIWMYGGIVNVREHCWNNSEQQLMPMQLYHVYFQSRKHLIFSHFQQLWVAYVPSLLSSSSSVKENNFNLFN